MRMSTPWRHLWWFVVSHISGCFWLFARKFWGEVGTYEWYFAIFWMQVEWWGHSEVVGTLKPYFLQSNSFEPFGGGDGKHLACTQPHPNEPHGEAFTTNNILYWCVHSGSLERWDGGISIVRNVWPKVNMKQCSSFNWHIETNSISCRICLQYWKYHSRSGGSPEEEE